jgi:hypothetical protein
MHSARSLARSLAQRERISFLRKGLFRMHVFVYARPSVGEMPFGGFCRRTQNLFRTARLVFIRPYIFEHGRTQQRRVYSAT